MVSRSNWHGSWANVLVALNLLAAASCTDDDSDPATATPAGPALKSCEVVSAAEPGGPLELTFWYSEDGARKQVLDELVSEFDAAHDSMTVEVAAPASTRDGLVDRWRERAPKQRPSLALLPDSATRLLADSGQTISPGRCLTKAVPGLVPAIETSWSVDGRLQAVPFAVSTPILLYSRSAFLAGGLDPDDPPATFADVRSTARTLVDRGVVPVGLLLDTGGNNGGSWFVDQWNAQAGALSLAPANGWRPGRASAVWHEGPTVDHLAWLRAMVADGLAESLGGSGGTGDITRVVGNPPSAAMTVHTCGSLGELSPALATPEPDSAGLGVAPLPGPGRGSLPGGAALWLAAGHSDEETAAAWSLAVYLASPESQARLAAATGYVPVTEAATDLEPLLTAWASHPGLAVAYRVLREQGTSPVDLGMSTGPEREVRGLLSSAVDATLAGSDPAEALRSAARETDLLLAAHREATRATTAP